MSITKPYTFQPNTKARANEVNANFDTLYSQANTNISNIEANARDIDELNDTKAELNGDSTQRFAVADPVNNTDAINKQTMLGQLAPTIDYIGGLTITKDSSSPNDTIIVSSGSCYDSTKAVVLNKNNSSTKTNDNQAANATYYVYVIGNATGSSIDILISESGVTPGLPSGYTLYRQIGYYTTNSSNNIDNIGYYGNDVLSNKSPSACIDSVMPDWSRKINIASPYTAKKYGWLNWGVNQGGLYNSILYINGQAVGRAFNTYGDRTGGGNVFVPLSPGDVVSWDRVTWANFIPCRGE